MEINRVCVATWNYWVKTKSFWKITWCRPVRWRFGLTSENPSEFVSCGRWRGRAATASSRPGCRWEWSCARWRGRDWRGSASPASPSAPSAAPPQSSPTPARPPTSTRWGWGKLFVLGSSIMDGFGGFTRGGSWFFRLKQLFDRENKTQLVLGKVQLFSIKK